MDREKALKIFDSVKIMREITLKKEWLAPK